jgi:cell wall-associated NlpC family hydrolase
MSAHVRLRALLLAPVLALSVLAAALSLGPVASASAASRAPQVEQATRIALQQVGDPYHYGSAGPRSFDCSGLLYYAFHRAGIRSLPRTASAQAHYARHIPRSRLHRGDLMFFTDGGRVYHAALFLSWSHGRAVMLHAPRTGQRVKRDTPWTNHWFAATLRY